MSLDSKIVLAITSETYEDLMVKLTQFQQHAEVLEIRFDYLKKPKASIIPEIINIAKKKLIFTLRNQSSGGNYSGSQTDFKALTEFALQAGFDYLDIDLNCISEINLNLKHPKTKLIVSYHNFNLTPGYRNLRKIQKKMRSFNPQVMKFATFSRKFEDNQTILRLLLSKKKTEKMIVMCMGEIGKPTRVQSVLLGGEFTWASFSGSSSAPGQISLPILKKLLKYAQETDKGFKN